MSAQCVKITGKLTASLSYQWNDESTHMLKRGKTKSYKKFIEYKKWNPSLSWAEKLINPKEIANVISEEGIHYLEWNE